MTPNRLEYFASYRERNKQEIRRKQQIKRDLNKASKHAKAKESAKQKKIVDDHPDRLLETIRIKLAAEQETFLYNNLEMARPQLFKLFKTRFNSNINKLQFNFALVDVASKHRKKLA